MCVCVCVCVPVSHAVVKNINIPLYFTFLFDK